MPVYMIANVKVTDESWIPDYAENVHGLVHKHGGKYLSRSPHITTIEGEAPDTTVIAIVEFPSMDSCQAFFADPKYAPFAKARQKGTVSNIHVIDDTDVAGSIPYLRKA